MTTYNMEQYMKDLEYLVNIDCNAQNFAGIDKVADYLARDFTGPMWRVLPQLHHRQQVLLVRQLCEHLRPSVEAVRHHDHLLHHQPHG